MNYEHTLVQPSACTESAIVSNLSFGYGETLLFDDFRLHSTFRRIVLKGPSGSGKTTLLKLMFGCLPASRAALLPSRNGAALILQDDALFPWLTGRSNIVRFLPEALLQIDQHPLFPIVNGFIDKPAYTMSFGQRRAIELFRVILLHPRCLYLDEPFNYLDDLKAEAFINYFLQDEVSPLVIVTTHRDDDALDASSDVFHFTGSPPYHELVRK